MAGVDNLRPLKKGEERTREIARKAGIASGEARRRKRNMRESLEILLGLQLRANGKNVDPAKVKTLDGLTDKEGNHKNITAEDSILLAMMQRAMLGDVDAARFVRDTVGDKPVDRTEVNASLAAANKLDDILEQLANDDQPSDTV